ncbi:MAG: tetratricopeptide repeat protein [Bacteroidales bacterium]|nr:tetratricopeptide repeat protein [Bacteroidales bacterium]
MRIEKKVFLHGIIVPCIIIIALTGKAPLFASADTASINSMLRQAESIINIAPEVSQNIALEAKNLSLSINYHKGIARSDYIFASNLRIANHNKQAIEAYYKCLGYYIETNDSLTLQDIYSWLGLCLAFEAHYDSGRVLIGKSIEIAKNLNQPGQQIQSLLNMARLHKSQGLLKSAIEDCSSALQHCNNDSLTGLCWKTENFLAYLNLLGNRHSEAAAIINKNMLSYKNYMHMPVEVCRLFYYASLLDMFLNNYSKVLYTQSESLKIAASIPNKNLSLYFKAMSYELLGKVYSKTQQFDSAKHYLFQAYNNPEFRMDLHALGEILFSIADVYYYQGQHDSALHFFKESARVQADNKNLTYLQWSYLGIGKAYYKQGSYGQAEKYLLLSSGNNSKTENIEIISEASKLLSDIYYKKNNFKKAYEHYRIFKTASDELFSRDKIRQITQIELENEFEDREQQLRHIQEQEKLSYELRIRQNKLTRNFITGGLAMALTLLIFIYYGYRQKQKANQEKEILLKEIHHRVKNNLQIISSMLSLQGSYLSDQKIKDAVNESQGRVKSMALIHQMLYQNDRFSTIAIRDYIEQLVSSVSSSFNHEGIKTRLDIVPVNMDIDTAIPLGLIINELLTNAHKYAFIHRNEGFIDIKLEKPNGNKFKLTIKDNGIGLPENYRLQKNNKTLGLNMVNILVRQLKGELLIDTEKGTGFTILVSENLKPQKKQ